MLEFDEIVDRVKKEDNTGLNLTEMNCYLSIEKIIWLYQHKVIDLAKANKYRGEVQKNYKRDVFLYETYQENIKRRNNTQEARIELRKLLKDGNEVTTEHLATCLNLSLSILEEVLNEKF